MDRRIRDRDQRLADAPFGRVAEIDTEHVPIRYDPPALHLVAVATDELVVPADVDPPRELCNDLDVLVPEIREVVIVRERGWELAGVVGEDDQTQRRTP